MKVTITKEFELSKKEIELLRYIQKEGYAEYRDVDYNSFEEFTENSSFYKNYNINFGNRSEEEWLDYFNNRNANGTYKEAIKLLSLNLIDYDDMAWHITFKLSSLGKEILKQNDNE